MSFFSSGKGITITIGSAAIITGGIFWLMKRQKPSEVLLAGLANIRACGSFSEDQGDESAIVRKWFANGAELSADARKALSRNVNALPDRAAKTLATRNIKFALESPRASLRCAAPGSVPIPGQSLSCLKSTKDFGDVLIISTDSGMGPDGKQLAFKDSDVLYAKLLPLAFWTIFESIWDTSIEPGIIEDNQPSRWNNFSRIKQYVVESLKFGPEEEKFYLKEFGGAGTKSPYFTSRTTALLASNLYCDDASFKRLSTAQPEAVKRFMSTFGCALGKPWHLGDVDFAVYCGSKS